jgi:transmembrane sensor
MRILAIRNVRMRKGRAALASAEEGARDGAIAWHLRLGDADEAEWQAFVEWLERDPIHRVEFDRVELADAEIGDAIGRSTGPPPVKDVEPLRWRWPLAGAFAAVAATLLFVFFSYSSVVPVRAFTTVQTSAGEQRTLTLADGSRLYLNGGTRVVLDRNNPRYAQVEQGEASFEVVHHADRPFTVRVGDATIQDVGTIFNVAIQGVGFELGVAEGAVIFNPDAENVKLTRGATLRVRSTEEPVLLGSVDPKSIGAWRRGQLVYDGEPLQNVADDIGRALGTRVSLSPAIAARPFTGVIIIDHDERAFFHRLAALLAVKAHPTAEGWHLGPSNRATDAGGAGRSGA